MADLFQKHKGCRNEREAIGNDQRTIAGETAQQTPDRDATGKEAVHRERNGSRVVKTQRFDCLREKADGGQGCCGVSNDVDIHDTRN